VSNRRRSPASRSRGKFANDTIDEISLDVGIVIKQEWLPCVTFNWVEGEELPNARVVVSGAQVYQAITVGLFAGEAEGRLLGTAGLRVCTVGGRGLPGPDRVGFQATPSISSPAKPNTV